MIWAAEHVLLLGFLTVERVVAGAAVVQAITAAVIVWLTVRIRAANDTVAAANQELVAEARRERDHAREQRSVEATRRVGAALTRLMVEWRGARDDEVNMYRAIRYGEDTPPAQTADEKRQHLVWEWRAVVLTERATIIPQVLVDDIERFWWLLEDATFHWDEIMMLAGEHGEDPTEPRERRTRSTLLAACENRLRAGLEAHQRGEPVVGHRLPRDSTAVLSLPRARDEDIEALIDD